MPRSVIAGRSPKSSAAALAIAGMLSQGPRLTAAGPRTARDSVVPTRTDPLSRPRPATRGSYGCGRPARWRPAR